jgi:hypothetical protein
MVFLNVSTTTASVEIKYFTSAGQPLTLPVSGVGLVAENKIAVPANGTASVEFDASSVPLVVGWAEVVSSASVRGQGIYHTQTPGQPASEAAVPLLVRESSTCVIPLPADSSAFPDALLLPFDNTDGYVSSIALANVTSAAATLDVEFVDATGRQLHSFQKQMPAHGHTAFATTDYAAVAGKQGLVRVRQNAVAFSAIAFLFSPGGAFTTLLPIAR